MKALERNFKTSRCKDLSVGDVLLSEGGTKKIKIIRPAGARPCWDIRLASSDGLFMGEPNFILSNGVVSHNCNLPVIDDCVRYIKANRGVDIKRDDIPINDRKVIKMASKGDFLGIFQFENPYTKRISDLVGIDGLEDIAAITSLIRPGPKDVGLDVEYAERKNGKTFKSIPILKQVMGDTFEILTYQEQLSKLAVVMAGFSPLEANALRKACSKKKVDLMASMKVKFIEGTIRKGTVTAEEADEIWRQIESTASYSFNKCLSPSTLVEKEDGTFMPLSLIRKGDRVRGWTKNGDAFVSVTDVINSGRKELWSVRTWGGREIRCTSDHKFLARFGDREEVAPLWRIQLEAGEFVVRSGKKTDGIKSVTRSGMSETMDITVDSEEHLFYGNTFITSNSHAVSYSAVTTIELWLRHFYFHEYMTALLQNCDPQKEKFGIKIFAKYIKHSRGGGLEVKKPDINESRSLFRLCGTTAYYPFGHIKNVSGASSVIESGQPYSSFRDFFEKNCSRNSAKKVSSRVVESLIYAGAFDRFGKKTDVMKEYHRLSGKTEKVTLARACPASAWRISCQQEFFGEISDQAGVHAVRTSPRTSVVKEPQIEIESVIPLSYDEEVVYTRLPDLSDKTLRLMEIEVLGADMCGSVIVKHADVYRDAKCSSLSGIHAKDDIVHLRVLCKIERITDRVNNKSGRNFLRVDVTDGVKDWNFPVWGEDVNEFRDVFQEGDVAVVPVKNNVRPDGKISGRFYDSRGVKMILERGGDAVNITL